MKNLFFLFFLLCFLLSCKNANENTAINESCKKLEEALKNPSDTTSMRQTLQKAYDIADKYTDLRHDSLVALASKAEGSIFQKKNDTQSRYYFRKGLDYGSRKLPVTEETMINLYRNSGLSYYNSDDYAAALRYFDSVKIISLEKPMLIIKTRNLINIAQCYQYLKDYSASERFFKEAATLAKTCMTEKELPALYMRYASCLRVRKRYTESVAMANRIVTILAPLSKNKDFVKSDSFYLANGYFYVAYAYEDSGKYDLAAKNFNLALYLYEKMNNIDNQVSLYLNLGLTYRYNKQFDKAENVLTEAISLINKEKKLSEFLHHKKGSLFINRSEVHMERKDYQKAIADHDSAIYYFTQYDKNPTLTALLMNNRHSLLSVYADKAKALIALTKKGQNTEGGYQQALNLFDKIIDVSDDIRADYISDDAKLTLAENIKPAFEKAMELCQTLYQKTQDKRYLQQAFAFSEHSRSMILNENVRLNSQLPKDLQAENADLKRREADLVAKSNTDDLQVYLRMKRAFREKIKTYNHSKILSVSALQQTLLKDGKTALIEYFVGDSTLFILTVTPDSMHIQALPRRLDLDKTVLDLRTAIIAENSPVFGSLSGQLYHYLLPNWVQNGASDGKIKRLILIPDGVLSYISFDMLGDYDEHKMHPLSNLGRDCLLKHYTISYAPSANFLMATAASPHKNTGPKNFMGFAPQYKTQDTVAEIIAMRTALTRDGAYNLPQAHAEVAEISNIVGGELFVNEAADEKTFKTQATQAKILHLAMHALADNDNPAQSRLLFTKNKADTLNDNDLTVAELNTLSLKADLAVLSACNTGFGKVNKGEGVMSIARAFHAAGVPSTVMSLWKVPDTETSALMIEFYKNLKSGLPKDEALRQAKLNYLNHVKLDSKASPLYWSAFVLSGSTDVVDFEGPLSIFVYLTIILGCVAVLFGFFKYRKSLK